MKIVSRPEDLVVGEGPYQMKFTYEDLQYLGALLYITRLGDGKYKESAFNMVNALEEMFDDDFLEQAASDVDLSISVLDDRDNIIEQHHNAYICIEV